MIEHSLERQGTPLVFDSAFLRKLERLELLARKVQRGLLRGEHSTIRRGHGLEFTDFRRYQPGDDFRYIDWNIFSRLDRLVLKLFTSEEDATLHLVVDASASMGFGDPAKFDHARRIAASLAYVGLNNLDRVFLHTFADGIVGGLPAQKSRRRITAVLDFLGAQDCGGTTALVASLRDLATRVPSPALVVIISDLLGDAEAEPGLDALRHRGHDLVLLQVLSEEEIDPRLDGALRLVDAEDGRVLKVTADAALRDAYRERMREFLASTEAYCRRSDIEYLRASTAVPFEDVMLRYLREGMHLR